MAAVGALRIGIYGLPVLTLAQRIAIFSMLSALSVLFAFTIARNMCPGTQALTGGILLTICFIAEEAVFLSVFHDYSLGSFMEWGTWCLRSGLLCAAPAALLVWLLVRRGYIVAPVSSGAAIGALAGTAGLTALELHCPILSVPHIAIWHVGVPVLSVAAGALTGTLTRSR